MEMRQRINSERIFHEDAETESTNQNH